MIKNVNLWLYALLLMVIQNVGSGILVAIVKALGDKTGMHIFWALVASVFAGVMCLMLFHKRHGRVMQKREYRIMMCQVSGIETVLVALGLYVVLIHLQGNSVDIAFFAAIFGASALLWLINFASIEIASRMAQRFIAQAANKKQLKRNAP
jgi:TctA family transporter